MRFLNQPGVLQKMEISEANRNDDRSVFKKGFRMVKKD